MTVLRIKSIFVCCESGMCLFLAHISYYVLGVNGILNIEFEVTSSSPGFAETFSLSSDLLHLTI